MINYIKSLGGLKEEPLNELSPELKQRAFDSASDEASKLKNSGDKDNYNPLKVIEDYNKLTLLVTRLTQNLLKLLTILELI
jgi:hypothetical protein